ncbi:SAVED domain-containing protein [Enterovibrio coralii]|uniref:2-methylthioadenine synthetase n=1 Tax=Enterovibrio coralii TaxID=294935 RepID=A0A135I3B6_9GAMM|nr:SAVED domain-containing protein [Enterovibrio coralii]KXF79939.1 hypothetical protein ATN88_11845 [Enterovibrio coralii]
MSNINTVLKNTIKWLFRRKSPAARVLGSGITLLTLSLAGDWALAVAYDSAHDSIGVKFSSSEVPEILVFIAFAIGVFLIALGVIWLILDAITERKRLSQKVVIPIEQRGLVNTSDDTLSAFAGNLNKGKQVNGIVIDIRDSLTNGAVSNPTKALDKVLGIERSIEERRLQKGADDVEIIYGGIVPVPFAFLTGYLLDDESSIQVVDWNRESSSWGELKSKDDDEKFIVKNVVKNEESKELVVAISFSYHADIEAIKDTFSGMNLLQLSLMNPRFNNHWSKTKQDRLAYEFIECIKAQLVDGYEKIHLILASQNSVAFRFGQAYDRRNLPPVTIYQYERNQTLKYPWGICIPNRSSSLPTIVKNKQPAAIETVF